MKHILVLVILFASCTTFAADTLHVISHKAIIVTTEPSAGTKSYRSWVVFPSKEEKLRKINLNITFGCPDGMRCADWDYLDHIYIRRKGGVNGPVLNYEIGRMLTPYGGAFGKTWSFKWQADITDFSLLLRDSIEIEYIHTGYEPNNDRGWKVTVDFELVKGKPVLEPVAVHQVYNKVYAYGDNSKPFEDSLKAFSFTASKRSQHARIFVYQTGHGMDANGCGEFCSRYREIWYNGRMIDKRDIWKKCGDNPLYPQAGTWVIDRAYWCPGELNQPDIYDVALKGGSQNVVDINMQPYVTDKPSANELITAYVVEYSNPLQSHDAAVEDIYAPTDKQVHGRKNPASVNPAIVIRNNGSHPLTKLDIRYGTEGFASKQFTWKGKLAFNQQAVVTLPGAVQGNTGQNTFTVQVSSPNGKKDAVMDDNSMSTVFTKVPVHGKTLVLNLRTNNQPEHNNYYLRNADGKVVYERKPGSLKANTDYRDTLSLVPGAYELLVTDTAGDGLEFWFNNKGGRGICRLLDDKGKMLRNFESDFGNFIHYGFEVSADSSMHSSPALAPAVGVYPTRSTGKTTLDYFGNKAGKVIVKIVTDPGDTVVEEHVYNNLGEAVFDYDMSYRPPQRYYVKVYLEGELVFNKRLRIEAKR